MPRGQAKYTEAQRAETLAYYEACGSQRKTALECGVPISTVRAWANGVKMNDDVRMNITAKKIDLADRIETLAHLLIDSAPGKIGDANLLQTMTSLGIAIDKLRLLRDKPTQIIDDVSLTDEARNSRVAQLLDLGRARGTGPSSAGDGATGSGAPAKQLH